MKRFVAKPSDRAAVVRELADSGGGSLESYYQMFGQYDGAGVFGMPDSHSMAAAFLAATSTVAFRHQPWAVDLHEPFCTAVRLA